MATKALTQGQPYKLILGFMIPVFLGNLLQQFYHFVDAIIVGRFLGIKALAAVGSCTALIFLAISFIFASTQGFSVVLAQKFGAKDYEMVRKSFATAIILSLLLTLILTLIFAPLTRFMLELLRTPFDILDLAYQYLFIMIVGIFATIFYNVATNTIRALGDSITPLYFLVFSVIANIFLDILFIIKFKWGVIGASGATVLAQAISTLFCLIFMYFKFPLLHLRKSDWKIDKDFVMEHLRIGIPMGFQMSVLTLGIIAVQFVLNGFGSIAVAAFTTATRIEQIFSQMFLALGATMAVYAAQNFGARKLSRIKEGAESAIIIASIMGIFTILIIKLFSDNLISLFMKEINLEVLDLANEYLSIVSICMFFLGLLLIFRNILQGMGSVIAPLSSGVAELIARAVGAFILGYYFKYTGICFATPLAWLSGAIVLFIGYKISMIKKFKKIKEGTLWQQEI